MTTKDDDDVFPASKFTFKGKKDKLQNVINPFVKGLPTKSYFNVPARTNYVYRPVENTELVIQQANFAEASRRLKYVKHLENRKKKIFAEEWKDLTTKLLDFRQSIKHFDSFCATNQDKRIRAMNKIEEEKATSVKHEAEFHTLLEQITTLKYIKQKREEDVKQHKVYENFLDKVIPLSGEFKTIKNIISRYNVLKQVEAETVKDYQNKISELKTVYEGMKNIHKKYQLREMQLVGMMTLLQSRHAETRNNTLKWEMAIEQVLGYAAKIRAETLGVLTTTDNIYEMICSRRNQHFDKNVPLAEKFYEIKETMATNRKVISISTRKPSGRKKSRWGDLY